MAQWYAQVGGQRYGPVDEQEMRSWVQQGRVGATDYVWCEGMANWVQAGSAFGITPSMPAMPPPGPGGQASTGVPPQPSGTGGSTPNTDLMSQAYESMRERWGIAIGFSLLMILLSMAAQMVPYGGGVIALIIGGPLQLGACIFFLHYNRGGRPEIGMLFAGFNWFGNALGTFLLIALFTFLWMLLLIVPGIIAALSYSQALFILADNPQLGPTEAIQRSKQLMDGHKWKLFCLGLWFFLLTLGCVLTCGIGFIWLIPYRQVTMARFYDDLTAAAGTVAGSPQ